MNAKFYLTLIILIIFCIKINSQVNFPTNTETGQVEFLKIVQLDSICKKRISFLNLSCGLLIYLRSPE